MKYSKNKTKSKIQNAMNKTRKKIDMGQFDEESFEVVPLIIENEKISPEFDNYKIVHITDIHIGQWITKEKLDGVVNIINKLNPDTHSKEEMKALKSKLILSSIVAFVLVGVVGGTIITFALGIVYM